MSSSYDIIVCERNTFILNNLTYLLDAITHHFRRVPLPESQLLYASHKWKLEAEVHLLVSLCAGWLCQVCLGKWCHAWRHHSLRHRFMKHKVALVLMIGGSLCYMNWSWLSTRTRKSWLSFGNIAQSIVILLFLDLHTWIHWVIIHLKLIKYSKFEIFNSKQIRQKEN